MVQHKDVCPGWERNVQALASEGAADLIVQVSATGQRPLQDWPNIEALHKCNGFPETYKYKLHLVSIDPQKYSSRQLEVFCRLKGLPESGSHCSTYGLIKLAASRS